MLRYLLDTNLCIRVLRYRPASVAARFNASAAELCTSVIVLTELLHGAARSARPDDQRRAVSNFVARLVVLPFDEDAAAHAAEIKAVLQRTGQVIGGLDMLIAGHARSRGLTVVTGNIGEFVRVPGLLCEDWLD